MLCVEIFLEPSIFFIHRGERGECQYCDMVSSRYPLDLNKEIVLDIFCVGNSPVWRWCKVCLVNVIMVNSTILGRIPCIPGTLLTQAMQQPTSNTLKYNNIITMNITFKIKELRN